MLAVGPISISFRWARGIDLLAVCRSQFGSHVTLNEMEVYEFSNTIDLAGTNVEDYNDLGVVFFLQNFETKEIHQSAYGIEDYVYPNDARLSELRVSNIPIAGFDPDVFEYTIELPEGITELVPVTATAFAGDPNITFEYPDVVPGVVTINILAEDLTTSSTYTIMLSLYTEIKEMFLHSVNIYPNPTNGLVHISGVENASISVYGLNGKLINSDDLIDDNSVDLSTLSNGIYLIKIQKGEAILTKKISLNRP